jgi:hypothetical protein
MLAIHSTFVLAAATLFSGVLANSPPITTTCFTQFSTACPQPTVAGPIVATIIETITVTRKCPVSPVLIDLSWLHILIMHSEGIWHCVGGYAMVFYSFWSYGHSYCCRNRWSGMHEYVLPPSLNAYPVTGQVE